MKLSARQEFHLLKQKRDDFHRCFTQAIRVIWRYAFLIDFKEIEDSYSSSLLEWSSKDKIIQVTLDTTFISLGVLQKIKDAFECEDVQWCPYFNVRSIPDDSVMPSGWILRIVRPNENAIRRELALINSLVIS